MQQKQLEKEVHWLLQEKYQREITAAARKDLARLKKGEPVDYLIGFVEFARCKIDLLSHPLIPRPETEHWILQAIHDIQSSPRFGLGVPRPNLGPRCLDIFAGSGCVGVAVLLHIPRARVDFAEKERKLLKQIRINLKKNSIDARRAHILQSDIFSNVKRKYDYIFANPPYVAISRWKSVQYSVARYEPKKALIAGKDGLLYIKRFLKEAKKHLNSEGKIYLEFDSPQKKEIDELLKKLGYSSWQLHKDQYNKYRFAVVSP